MANEISTVMNDFDDATLARLRGRFCCLRVTQSSPWPHHHCGHQADRCERKKLQPHHQTMKPNHHTKINLVPLLRQKSSATEGV